MIPWILFPPPLLEPFPHTWTFQNTTAPPWPCLEILSTLDPFAFFNPLSNPILIWFQSNHRICRWQRMAPPCCCIWQPSNTASQPQASRATHSKTLWHHMGSREHSFSALAAAPRHARAAVSSDSVTGNRSVSCVWSSRPPDLFLGMLFFFSAQGIHLAPFRVRICTKSEKIVKQPKCSDTKVKSD